MRKEKLNVVNASDRAYFAPEVQYSGTDIKHLDLKAADMYSYGVLLHELMSRGLPFDCA